MPKYIRFVENGVPIRGAVGSGIHMGWSELVDFNPGGPARDRERDGVTVSQLVVTKVADSSSPTLMRHAKFWSRLTARSPRAVGRSPTALKSARDGQTMMEVYQWSHKIEAPHDVASGASGPQAAQGQRFWRSRSGHLFGFSDSGQTSESLPHLIAEVEFTLANGGGGEFTVLRTVLHDIRITGYQPAAQSGRGGNAVAVEKLVIVHEGFTRAGEPNSARDITAEVRAYLELYDYPGSYAQRFDGVD